MPLAEMFGYATTLRSLTKAEELLQWNLIIIKKCLKALLNKLLKGKSKVLIIDMVCHI